jgi:hypothetical protein
MKRNVLSDLLEAIVIPQEKIFGRQVLNDIAIVVRYSDRRYD